MTDNDHACSPSDPNQTDDFFRQLDIQLLIHGMKGPLDVIETNTRMLLEFQNSCGSLSSPQQRALKRSLRSAAKLRSMINGLLEVGRCQTGRISLRRFDAVPSTMNILVEVLETEVMDNREDSLTDANSPAERQRDYLAANGIHLDISPAVEAAVICQDETKYEHMLSNLFRNAMHYRRSQVVVQMRLAATDLEVRVCDDGPGIAPEDQGDLFKRYSRLKTGCSRGPKKGHGFGLAGARILARSLDGDITLDTGCLNGAAFVLRMPLVLDERSARAKGYIVCAVEGDGPTA